MTEPFGISPLSPFDRMGAALKIAAGWFEGYAESHRAKGTAEGLEKSLTNYDRAQWLKTILLHAQAETALACNDDVIALDIGDSKYDLRNGRITNKVSGEAIPADEPIIIFRGRDVRALNMLALYLADCKDADHRWAVASVMSRFAAFAAEHPDRMKEPGITHHFDLAAQAHRF